MNYKASDAQEALDVLKGIFNTDNEVKELTKDIMNIFQELIDNYQKLEKAFELLSIDYFNSQGGYYFDDREDMKNKYLLRAEVRNNNA